MDLWDQVFFSELLGDNVLTRWGGGGAPRQGISVAEYEEHYSWACNHTFLYGKIRQAVRITTIQEVGGEIRLGYACTKTG